MKTLYIERSGGEGRGGEWVENLDLAGVGRIVVGIGPGSFAGIRSALAFAQGYALGKSCELRGLPSPCALVAPAYDLARIRGLAEEIDTFRLVVAGDARQGKTWLMPFVGFRAVREVFQVTQDRVAETVASLFDAPPCVITPDERRIGPVLQAAFGDRFLGGALPTGEGLRAFAEADPSVLISEPLPIYLNPAVRN